MPPFMTKNKIKNNVTVTKKIIILFFIIVFALFILILSVSNTITKDRHLPKLLIEKNELAVRGTIYSKDNFKISSSKKLYKATIDTRCLDLDKRALFVKLFSIYSDIPTKIINKKIDKSLKKRPGTLVLSYRIDSRTAKNLKELAYKLRRLKVFKSIKVHGSRILYGLSIHESGEKRVFAYKDSLTPVIGYMKKVETKAGKTKVAGIKGLEKTYQDILENSRDGRLKGYRDVLSYISFDKSSQIQARRDGANLILNIPLKLQKNIEMILDKHKKKLSCDEIIVSIIETQTGKVLALASSNRFNPDNIHQKDIPYLNVNAIEYEFEPGSVVKPISISLVMDKNRIKRNELFNAYNKGRQNSKGEFPKGRYPLGKFVIRDDHNFKKRYITVEDIVIYSSNIGTLQLAQRLSAKEFVDGLHRFGITRKTGIDLPYEKVGRLPKLRRFKVGEKKGKDNVYKATVSYGQGMTATFMQILKAYTAFNNDGKVLTPQIVAKIISGNQIINTEQNISPVQVIKKSTANKMKKLLIKTVKKGTGKSANIEGLEIGGKTGTANIARKGSYQKKYISSFFGFANDEKHKYTIGVSVLNPISTGEHWYYYYASHSAVPVFKELIETMVKLNYLQPKK
jgi:cell division protein FtsI (penicillin-binding protein 3)